MAEAARAAGTPDDPIVIWEPQPKQAAFITCPCDDVGFGGARGGGKSDAVIGDWVDHEDLYGDAAVGLAFRRERTQLVELIERAKQILPLVGHKWHEQDKYFRGPKGGRLRFAYLENDSDADAYQGHGYTRLYPEEMGTFPNEAPINKMQGTLRSGHGVPCQMKATLNPGGPGHQWCKARYKLQGIPAGFDVMPFEFINPFTKKKITKTRVFIPSRVTDNKYLGDDYIGALHQVGSEPLVRAWMLGDWDIVEGQFFDGWRHEKHVVAPFVIPPDWLRFRSMDWGYATPFSIGWWAVCPDDKWIEASNGDTRSSGQSGVLIPRGAIVRYREWYGASAPNVGLRLTPEQVGDGIVDRERGEKVSYGVLDPSAFDHRSGPSEAERLHNVLLKAKTAPFRHADNTRVSKKGHLSGWNSVRSRLRGDGEYPALYVFSTCRDFIRTFPVLQHDRDNAEDLDTEQEDHAADEARYACSSRPYIPKVIVKKPDEDLKYEAREDGRIVANLSVREWAERKRKKKLREA